MRTSLDVVAPAFRDMAHSIVWCTVATVTSAGHPRTRVLHPVWEWDGSSLQGWIATSPTSPKAADLAENPTVSLTYWSPDQNTCTAECIATWSTSDAERSAGWERFVTAPAPVGYDPSIVPAWTSPDAEEFGILHLAPTRLRVQPATLMTSGAGAVLTWSA
jgi:general stress protein 26